MEIKNVTYHSVVQGSPEWRALRQGRCTASMAAAAMGRHKYTSRSELLQQMAGGDEPEPTKAQSDVYRRGHDAESAARPIAEAALGEELYPATVTAEVDGLPMLASVDGMDLLGEFVWEHKLSSEALRDQIRRGDLEDHYLDQLQQQMLLTGAGRAILVASDGTSDDWHETTVHADPAHQRAIVEAWRQAMADAADFEPAPAEAVATPQSTLPTPAVQVHGEVAVHGNLQEFGEALRAYVDSINLQPQTDQEFADLDAAAKRLKEAEDALTAAEDQALAQTASIQEMRQAVQEYRDIARQTRLQAEKAVKAEKENRKAAIRDAAVEALRAHYEEINASLEGVTLGVPAGFSSDVAAAMKGKKTIASLQDAADTALANAKLEANERADRARAVLQKIQELPEAYQGLFRDVEKLADMDPEAAQATVKARVEEEDQWLEAERERIRQEEERKAREAAEQERKQLEAERESAQQDPAVDQGQPEEAVQEQEPEVAPEASVEQAAATHDPEGIEPEDDGVRLKLSDINAAIAPLSISAAGLSELGIDPVGQERSAKLYRAADLPRICEALIHRLREVAKQDVREAA